MTGRSVGWGAAMLALGCGGECPALRACDIREGDCQRETASVAACLYGGDAVEAKVEVVDAEQFVADQVVSGARVSERREEAALRRGLAMLSLAPEAASTIDSIRQRWSRVGASYFADDDRIVVLDRGHALDGPQMTALLLHEYVHALQHADAAVDHAAHRGSYDEELAFRGMTEGQAVLYQDLALVDGFGRSRDGVAWDAIFRSYQRREWEESRQNDAPYELSRRYFPYAFGGHYVSRAFRDEPESAHAIVSSPPSSTREVLAGYGSVPADGTWEHEPTDVAIPALPAELEHVATRRLGAWLFASWLARWRTDAADDAVELDVAGRAGDVLAVFLHRDTDDVVVSWRIRFDDAQAAASVAAALAGDARWVHVTLDRDLVVLADTRGAPTAGFLQSMSWGRAAPDDWTWAETTAAAAADEPTWRCAQPPETSPDSAAD